MKSFPLGSRKTFGREIRLGASFVNMFNAKLSFSNEEVDTFKSKIPQIFRAGAGILYDFSAESAKWYEQFGINAAAEYSACFNYDNSNGYGAGVEFSLMSYLFARAGYYDQKTYPTYYLGGTDSYSGVTFGGGLKVPVYSITNDRLPVVVRFDYAQLKEPAEDFTTGGTYRVFEVNVNVIFGR